MNADAIHATILTLFMEKSINDSARALYMRPSSVYWRVKRAEKLLGDPLVVVRNGRRFNGFLNPKAIGYVYETIITASDDLQPGPRLLADLQQGAA